jgi:hypothetical protein
VATRSERASPPSPIFGGEGAVVGGLKETPLPAGDAAPRAGAGPCSAPARPGDVALIDDFEDGDSHVFKAFERDGWWWSASDTTDGAKLYPEAGKFTLERLLSPEATKDNLFAAHFKASGQRDWGAAWGATLQWESKGIRCPFNASAFAGIRFRAKGPGSVRVALALPETQATEFGGACTSGCYDFHGKIVYLSDRWADYLVAWDRLQQGGWGAQARFDPSRLMNVSFATRPKELPADFWVDDLALVTASEAQALAAADRAQPAGVPSSAR